MMSLPVFRRQQVTFVAVATLLSLSSFAQADMRTAFEIDALYQEDEVFWGQGALVLGVDESMQSMPTPTVMPIGDPTVAPVDPTPSPISPTLAPMTDPPTPSPFDPTLQPVEPTSVPVEPTPSPVEPTPVPEALPTGEPPTPSPVAPTQSPVEPTTSPIEPSPAPESMPPTPLPFDPTLAPIDPTSAPVEPSPSPEAVPTGEPPTLAPVDPKSSPVDPPTPSPVDPTPSPVDPTPSPVDPTPSPVDPTPSPMDPTPSPVDPTPSPVDPTSSPVDPTPSPIDPTPAPVEPTPSPVDPTPVPVDPTPSPIDPTPPPVDPSPAPVVPTPSPFDPTPSPIDPTPPPVDPTPAPVDPTPSPIDPTPAPFEPTPSPVDPTPAPLPDIIDPEPTCDDEYSTFVQCEEREETCIGCPIAPPGGPNDVFTTPGECDDEYFGWISSVNDCGCDVCQEFLGAFEQCKACEEVPVTEPTPAPFVMPTDGDGNECQEVEIPVDSECCNTATLLCDDGDVCCYSEETDSNVCIDTAFLTSDDGACVLELCTAEDIVDESVTSCDNCRSCLQDSPDFDRCLTAGNPVQDCVPDFSLDQLVPSHECKNACYKGSKNGAQSLQCEDMGGLVPQSVDYGDTCSGDGNVCCADDSFPPASCSSSCSSCQSGFSITPDCCEETGISCDDGESCCPNGDSFFCTRYSESQYCLEPCTTTEVGQDFLTMDCQNCRDCLLACPECPNIDECFGDFRTGQVCSECELACFKGSAADFEFAERRGAETRQTRGYTRGSASQYTASLTEAGSHANRMRLK